MQNNLISKIEKNSLLNKIENKIYVQPHEDFTF